MTRPLYSSDTDPALLTFEEAAGRLHGAVSASALRRARIAGKLWAKKLGKRYFTTWHAVLEFLECPDTESPPASISAPTNANGSFVTAAPSGGQDLAMASAERLKRHSLNTSRRENRPTAEARHIRGADRRGGAGPVCR
ncbi:hypothetical protein PE067_08775 [Paracoccus sp. DMF-8]|uniref:hypothetical protein n=1 Tax=Paracoccus sp. DMF-8 TaxID=3019445 RepID=UPI0023E86D3D|nr:hypothetical protein [Paracoccus sp. DMF-8]MDF3606217.1 hypothetical protein [Paracoccus sp. DMF-8]